MDWHRILALIKLLHLDSLALNTAVALGSGAVLCGILVLVERHYGRDLSRYRRGTFWQDVGYFLYYSSGLHMMLFTTGMVTLLQSWLGSFRLNLLGGLPPIPRFVVFFLVVDLIVYWYHRWEHASSWLWYFHAVHHSQKDLTLFTQGRVHPVTQVLVDALLFVPVLLMGASALDWLPILLARRFLDALQHSQIPWRFGPFYYVLVSPAFHNVHHSVRPEYHDRNYGVVFSFWDFLFGTAVTPREVPSEFGLTTLQFPSLRSQLLDPFLMAFGVRKTPPQESATAYRAETAGP